MSAAPHPVPPTTVLADVGALHGVGVCLTPPLRVLNAPAAAVAGPARTVRFAPGPGGAGLAPLYELLSEANDGAVLVVAGAAEVAGSGVGQIIARAALQSGIRAAVVDGAVRDVDLVAGEGLPLVARHLHTLGIAGLAHVDACGTRVTVGGVSIADGDLVVVDVCGAVALPAALADRILDDGRLLADAEDRLLAALAAGDRLATAYRHKRAATDAIRAGALTAASAHTVGGTN